MKCKMKSEKLKVLGLFFPVFLMGENFDELVKFINNSNIVKIYEKNIAIQKEKLNQAKAKNLGQLDLEYDYMYLFDRPVMKMNNPQPIAAQNAGSAPIYPLIYKKIHSTLNVGKKNNFVGKLTYSYPIFTGFLITNFIKIEKLNLIKERLKLNNIKRDLKLKVAKIYAGIYALNKKIDALNEAKKALLSARDKANALYKEGLINKSTLDEIDAKYYEIKANIDETKSNRNSLLNLLSYLVNKKINSIDNLPSIKLLKPNFLNRPDVKEIQNTLKIASKNINIQKSNFYPKVYFQAGIKKEATDVTLNNNDYRNVDNSFVAVSIKYNIFNGGSDKAKLQEAKLEKLKALIFYKDYLNKVKTDYKNDLLNLNAFKKRLISANKEVNARDSYYEYIRAKFNEGLADVTDLNSAIAKLSEAKAKRDYIKSQIFFYTLKSNIDGGN